MVFRHDDEHPVQPGSARVTGGSGRAALLFAFVLLLILSFVGRRRGGQSERPKVSK